MNNDEKLNGISYEQVAGMYSDYLNRSTNISIDDLKYYLNSSGYEVENYDTLFKILVQRSLESLCQAESLRPAANECNNEDIQNDVYHILNNLIPIGIKKHLVISNCITMNLYIYDILDGSDINEFTSNDWDKMRFFIKKSYKEFFDIEIDTNLFTDEICKRISCLL